MKTFDCARVAGVMVRGVDGCPVGIPYVAPAAMRSLMSAGRCGAERAESAEEVTSQMLHMGCGVSSRGGRRGELMDAGLLQDS